MDVAIATVVIIQIVMLSESLVNISHQSLWQRGGSLFADYYIEQKARIGFRCSHYDLAPSLL
jgi:hypothetical protein